LHLSTNSQHKAAKVIGYLSLVRLEELFAMDKLHVENYFPVFLRVDAKVRCVVSIEEGNKTDVTLQIIRMHLVSFR